MSDHNNSQPPVLGRRTNQGSHRVVRATGTQGVQQSNHSSDTASSTVEPEQQNIHKESEQKIAKASTSTRATRAVQKELRYERSEQAAKIADELFVDKGIEVAPEVVNTQVSESASSSHDVSHDNSEHPEETTQRVRARRTRSRRMDEDQNSNVKMQNSSQSNESSSDNTETQRDRSRRARAAVSQMLEFSSSDENTDTAQSSEQFSTRANPMMSLLFQAPVIPQMTSNEDADNDVQEDRNSRRSRRNRREKSSDHNEVLDNITHALDETERSRKSDATDSDSREEDEAREETTSIRSRRRKDKSERTKKRSNRQLDDEVVESSADESIGEDDGPRRRSRRLNAQERRAAAEVELIESDLEFDDISYEPIESDENSSDNEDSDEATDKLRRRSRRSRQSIVNDDDSEEEFTTRRRRRRRGAHSSDESTAVDDTDSTEEIPLRSRKQQYIDEITDVAGSTRLEAKRQRRRDNRRDRNRQAALITEQDFLARREVVNRIMVVRERGNHTQVSVIEDDVLVEHYISDIEEVSAVGNIYQGRVQNVLPSMEAAFVDIGQARNGVLYAGEVNWDTTRLDGQPRRMEHAFKSGDPVLVQVTKDPIGHKGARLTSQVTLAGRFLVLVPSGGMTGVSRKLPERERARLKSIVSKVAPEGMGVIIRTAAEGASEEAIIKDLEHLKNQWTHISEQLEEYKNSKKPHLLQGEPDVVIRVIRDIFNDDFKQLVVEGEGVYNRIHSYIEAAAPDLLDRLEQWDPAEHRGKDVFDRWQIDSQLRKGMERQVYLPSGGSLVIDRTEAMTTIDVNTGRFIGKGKSLEETVTRCNLEAAEEVVRQLRLRDIGGMVMIDFVDMVMPANRDLVLRRLVECLSRDRTKHQVAEVTSLGLVQMTRKRVGQGLVEAFSEECPTCGGRGFILHDEPTVSSQYDDPYAMKGGDPFIKTNKHSHSAYSASNGHKESNTYEELPGTAEEVKNSMAAIAAAGVVSANEVSSQSSSEGIAQDVQKDAEN